MDPEAENGMGSIGSVDAMNMDFSQTQATQAPEDSQVGALAEMLASAGL